MTRRQMLSLVAVAVVALTTGFLVAGQVRAQLLTPSNQVARYQALVRSVQDLEATNADARARIATLRVQIDALESEAARRSAATQVLRNEVADLRAHAGLTAMHGPGIEVRLANGVPGPDSGGLSGYLVNYQDVQDVINLLFEGVRRHDEYKRAVTLVPDDIALQPTGTASTPLPDEDADFAHLVWTAVVKGTTARTCESSIATDGYRIRRLLAHWLEEGALAAAA